MSHEELQFLVFVFFTLFIIKSNKVNALAKQLKELGHDPR